jgi:hypothetical protein
MGDLPRDFRPRLRISRGALLIVGGSVLVHAIVILAAYLAPETPPEPSQRWSDCVESSPATGDPPLTADQSGRGVGGAGSAGSGAHRVGSSFALGPEVAVPQDAEIIWPCCGPGCPTELVLP